MKFICTDDWHIRNSNPKHRIDDFKETQRYKIHFILDTAIKHKAWVLVAGDIFNSAKEPYRLLWDYINQTFKVPLPKIITVPGQHDMKYHNTKEFNDTPLGNLYINDIVNVVGDVGGCVHYPDEEIYIYGCGWGESIPIPSDLKGFNILLIHEMISKKKEWPGHEYIPAYDILKRTKFDLIISGDNHKTFTATKNGKTLINAGSIVRQKSDETQRKPCIFLFDTETRKYEKIYIPVKPAEEVFDLQGIEKQEIRKEQLKMSEFVDAVSINKTKAPDFLRVLKKVIKEVKPHKRASKYIDQFIEEAKT